MTDETYDNGPSGDSRRSFMKKGALAASAVAFGAGATAGTAAAQDDGDVLAFSYDYFPGADFEVLAVMEQSTTNSVLRVDDEEVDEIDDPSDWDGHVIRYDMGGDTAGVTTFLFSEDGLSEGDSGTLGEDARMFSDDLNLLEVSLDGNGGNGGDDEDEEDDEEMEEDDEEMDDNETEGNETA
ncbi:calcium-binding protein [Salinilacihabitans rarus]|uniref:calcium-binding protein n=1 Tax=Salinilacihabitans rarus TaxID=2961596 RepID=UPI0020C8368C|nr:calcium-binding protein [Salinilacihabitans rarus]